MQCMPIRSDTLAILCEKILQELLSVEKRDLDESRKDRPVSKNKKVNKQVTLYFSVVSSILSMSWLLCSLSSW